MKTTNRSSMAAVAAAALLLGALVGVVWASPRSDGPQPTEITRKVTLAPADFVPGADGGDWWKWGNYIVCESDSCQFIAPVVFPCLPSVTIERIKLHVDDWNDAGSASATLCRVRPSKAVWDQLGWVGSPWGTNGGFQTYNSDPINKVVWPSQRACVKLSMYTDMKVYGATIEYHRNI